MKAIESNECRFWSGAAAKPRHVCVSEDREKGFSALEIPCPPCTSGKPSDPGEKMAMRWVRQWQIVSYTPAHATEPVE